MEIKNFREGDEVEFTDKTTAYDLDTKNSFSIPKGKKAVILEDQDAGEAGACKVKLDLEGGKEIVVEVDDKNLKKM